jgi:hypothetical protein
MNAPGRCFASILVRRGKKCGVSGRADVRNLMRCILDWYSVS